MTTSPELLLRIPTTTSSEYLRSRLHDVFDDIIKQPSVSFNEKDFGTDHQILEFCHAALSKSFRMSRSELHSFVKIAPDRLSADEELSLKKLTSAENDGWSHLVDFQALTKANGIAEFVDYSAAGEVKDYFLPVVGGSRNEGLATYIGLWKHLGVYANELNDRDKSPRSYVPDLSFGPNDHFDDLATFRNDSPGNLIAVLGSTSIYGSLQTCIETPTMVALTLKTA
ncbi:MAG: hypothetical protein ABI602_02830 [Candidatus Saccharibacteria bacterium]